MQADSACYVCKIAPIDVLHFCMGLAVVATLVKQTTNILPRLLFLAREQKRPREQLLQTSIVLQSLARLCTNLVESALLQTFSVQS